jgi:hypothetical protein
LEICAGAHVSQRACHDLVEVPAEPSNYSVVAAVGLAGRLSAGIACRAVLCFGVCHAGGAVRSAISLFSADVLSFATFYPAILIVTLVGGLWLGVLAAALGGLFGVMFLTSELIPTQLSLADSANLILYSGAAAAIIWVAEQYRRLVRHLDQEEHYRQILVA